MTLFSKYNNTQAGTKDFEYQKPSEICEDASELYLRLSDKTDLFAAEYKKNIENEIQYNGFRLRMAAMSDVDNALQLIAKRYPSEIAEEISPYDIYRFITFSHGLIVENAEGTMIGCLFEEGLDTPDRTSYTLRLAVDPYYSGFNLGILLIEYSCLLAMERGSNVKRGLLDIDNYPSAAILINKIGWIAEQFYPNIHPLGTCFTISLPLTPKGFCTNRISLPKILQFIAEKEKSVDYELACTDDVNAISDMYERGFLVVAFLKQGVFDNNFHCYFALPKLVLHPLSASS